jgi:hypothetical protein
MMLDDATRRRRQAARRARDQRHRRRLREGRVVVPVEVDERMLTLLVRLHWLRECDAAEREKIAAAINRLLHTSAAIG